MRKQIWIPSIIILAICLLALFKPGQNQKITLPAQDATPANNSSQVQQPKIVDHHQITNIAQIAGVFPPKTPFAQALAKTNPIAAIRLSMWQAPIEFYGRVVDENSNAISGVNVHFSWYEIPADNGERTTNTQSDSEGLFSLHGKYGPSLSVGFSKEGYNSSHRGEVTFNYALGPDIISPDPLNPVIFLIHKKGQGVELVTSEHGMQPKVDVLLPRDNTPVQIDLFQKKASATGELEISQNKPPFQVATNWSFSLNIPDGGLVENQDEFQFAAPVSGYQPTVKYEFAKGETNWTTQVSKQFYIAFGQPRKYGWLRIESNLAQQTVFLTYAINPDGSRNLEPK